MRLFYISDGYTPHDHRFLTAMVGGGHAVHYWPLDPVRALESRPLPQDVRLVSQSLGGRRPRFLDGLRQRRRLDQMLREIQPELVHAGPVQRGAFLASLVGFRPLVTMSWGSDLLIGARGGSGRWVARFTLSRTSVFVCDCQVVREAAERLGMPGQRIVVFPWGVDLQHFSPSEDQGVRSRLGWGEAFVLLSTRSLEPQYGIGELAMGFIRAARVDPRLRLLVLGRGSLRAEVGAMLAEAGMLDRVHFAGQVGFDRLPAYYHAADLYVSASHSDGSSVSLLEAMACGLPALVSDIPGNREWVDPGVNGWWFRVGDAETLADRILAIRKGESSSMREIGAQGRSIAEARADWDQNVHKLFEAYAIALDHVGEA